MPQKIGDGPVLVCNICGHVIKVEKLDEYKVVKRAKILSEAEPSEGVTVIEEESKPALPTTKAKCPECGHNVAYWWLRQTRAADEATTRFYRCTKCTHTWREYT